MSPSITIEVPAPQAEAEHTEAKPIGRALNPAYRSPIDDRRELDPDSPLIDPLLTLARALWSGDECRVELPLNVDTDVDRAVLADVVGTIHPGNNTGLDDTGIGAALGDLFYALSGALAGTTAEVARTHLLIENALWNVGSRCNVDGHNDRPLMDEYDAALLKGAPDAELIATQRDKFRQEVRAAEKAMDKADRLLAEGGAS